MGIRRDVLSGPKALKMGESGTTREGREETVLKQGHSIIRGESIL